MQKLSSDKVAAVLADANKALLSVAAERDKLAAENTLLKRRAEAEKLAFEMHDKGIQRDVPFAELVTDLEKAASEGRLEVLQEAVNMTPKMAFTQMHLRNDDQPGGAENVFESFLLGDVG